MNPFQSASTDPNSSTANSPIDSEGLFTSVLLIEDDAAHARLISRALNGIVGEVAHVSTGRQALDYLIDNFAELVFCDLNLPDMPGAAVIQEIRRLRPGLPIVVLTSSSHLDHAVQAMREGAWDFMLKQFDGDLRGQIELVIERTARRKLGQLRELEVRAERDAFSVAAFTAQDGLAILSKGGQVVFANEAFGNFCRTLCSSHSNGKPFSCDGGFNLVDLVGEHDFVVAGDLHKELNILASESLWSSELTTTTFGADGEKQDRFFELSLSAVAPSQLDELEIINEMMPAFRYLVMWVRDITRRKEQERFQRDLLATTSHDLKGPLGAILTSAELLAETPDETPERSQALLTRIASCARNSISIIDELLSARRIQDGVLVVRQNWYPLDEMLQDAVLDYLPIAKSKAIEFSARPSPVEMKIYADRLSLSRVLGNLISNALKFTPKNGKVIISAKKVRTGVRIAVSDTGPGIEASARHKLFERFSRLEKHANIDGTGLGLFVTKNIVEAHNGTVEVRSKVGQGTTFFVTFPDPQP